LSYDKRIAAIFVVSAAATFIALRLVASLIMWGAAKLPRFRLTALRLAIANIHRPGALTPSVVLSLGLGLAVLVIVVQIDGNLRRQFQQSLPDRSPAFFFVDIQNNDAKPFDEFIHKAAPGATVERVPMLRGQLLIPVLQIAAAAATLRLTRRRRSEHGRQTGSEPGAG
jgi:putative ABC transport system permease protein